MSGVREKIPGRQVGRPGGPWWLVACPVMSFNMQCTVGCLVRSGLVVHQENTKSSFLASLLKMYLK